MNDAERAKNRDEYIVEVTQTIKNLVERCGGSLDEDDDADTLPRELVCQQRDLFIHSGIAGILTNAILEQDRETIELFDWLLGYYVGKDRVDQSERNQFIRTIMLCFHAQIIKDCGHDHDQKFDHFMVLSRLGLLILDGTMSQDEIKEVRTACTPVLARCLIRNADKRRQDAEKN